MRIVALAPNDWDAPWMNRQNLLSRLAREHKIVYSNGIWAPWHLRTTAYARAPYLGRFDIRDGVSVDSRSSWLMRIPRVRTLDQLAIQAACFRWRNHLARYPGPLVAYLFHPEYLPFLKRLRADYVVYHAYDLFRFMGPRGKYLEPAENSLLDIADLVIATSEETAADMRSRNNRRVEVLGNGVDLSRFPAGAAPPERPELANIPRPRIGYVGAINQKVDFELVLALAKRRPSWQFVFVGEIDNLRPGDAELIAALRACHNIHILDAVPQREVPGILLNLDVGLVCYRTLKWTLAGYPLKALEYLACGLPVVATNLPALQSFADVIAIAESADEWEKALAAAIAGRGNGNTASRVAMARANSWDTRVARLDSLLGEMVSQRAPAQRSSLHSRTRIVPS
jgi:glycosyltransferase involved in cell wall biosynthesis